MLETRDNSDITTLANFDTVEQARKWIVKNQHKYFKELHVGTHLKDGFVVYQFQDLK